MIRTITNTTEIQEYLNEYTNFMSSYENKYLSLKKYDDWINKHKDFLSNIDKKDPKFSKVLNTVNCKNEIIKKHNRDYLKKALIKNKDYFDNMFVGIDDDIKLDYEQRKILLADEENLLVIAGAGSGKTTTMIAKVKYLIDKYGYKESEIAVISFTKKVCEEISDVIHNKLGLKNVDVLTFHALGLKIINASGRNVKAIAEDGIQYKIITNYIKNILFEDKKGFSRFYRAFSNRLYDIDDSWKDFKTFREYHEYKYKKKMEDSKFDLETYNKDQIERRRKYKKTINGEYLRSKEEVDIANFLYLNGIEYEYEKKFDDSNKSRILYHPDFFIRQLEKENYIEHFGVNENCFNSMYNYEELKAYRKNMRLKIKYHNQENNLSLFISTYSSYSDGRSYIEHLKDELLKKGYQFNKKTEEEIYKRLMETSEDSYISNFVDKIAINFIKLFKEENRKEEDFELLKNGIEDDLKLQLDVMRDIYIYYNKYLKDNNLIDFQDMIHEAHNVISSVFEKDMGVDYKYIIIDEYQDISNQRFDLTKKISELFNAKIMAVGDDWQSIYGYAGSRLFLFLKFQKFLDNAKWLPIKNTYRNSQELIDIAGKFVMKNRNQIYKRLYSKKHLKNPIEIYQYDDTDVFNRDYNHSKVVEEILERIERENKKAKVLLLGRYNGDIYKLSSSENFVINGKRIKHNLFPNLKLDFLTVHKAKGLGSDECILINAEDSRFGFPSKIEDYPIIKIIRSNDKEPIDYAEERRLFYVAMTRTKNKFYIIVPSSKVSCFVDEISQYKDVIVHGRR